MSFGVHPIGELSIGEISPAEDISSPSNFWRFQNDEYSLKNYIIQTNPSPVNARFGFETIGELSIGELSIGETQQSLYWSTERFETAADEQPPSTVFTTCLETALDYTASIPLPGLSTSQGRVSYGTISVANVGDFDSMLVDNIWEGESMTIYLGGTISPGMVDEYVLKFNEYRIIYKVDIANIQANELGIDFSIKDPGLKLLKSVQVSEYSGAGGYNGDRDIRGFKRPICFGNFLKVPGVLINAVNFIYQYHDGGGTTVTTVSDKGINLIFSGDSSDLFNTTVAVGHYKTDLSRGLIRVNASPAGVILVDGVGVGGGTISSIVELLVLLSGQEINRKSFHEFGDYQAQYYVGLNSEDIGYSISELINSISGYWFINSSGEVQIGEHLDVRRQFIDDNIEGRIDVLSDMSCIIIESSLSRNFGPINIYQYSVGFNKYWSINSLSDSDIESHLTLLSETYKGGELLQRVSDLADTITAASRADLEKEYRKIQPIINERTRTRFKDSISVEKNTYLTNETEVRTLANQWLSRDSRSRYLYSFSIIGKTHILKLGNIIQIYHDRFGLHEGKKGIIVNISENTKTGITKLRVLVYE